MPLRISRTCLAQAAINSPVPFLYQTRTLAAPLSYAKWSARDGRSFQSTSTTFTTPESSLHRGEESAHDGESSENATPPLESDSPSPAPSNDGRRSRRSYLKKRGDAVSQSRTPPSSQPPRRPLTMTESEKRAFGGLLEQMGVKEKEDLEAATEATDKPALSKDEMHKISNIFNSVLEDLRKKKEGSEVSTEGAGKRKSRRQVDEPASTSKPGPQEQAVDSNPPESRSDVPRSAELAIQFTVQRESAKIERALRAAIDEGKGDTGIWEVCKERVFSMLRYLGESRVPEDSGALPTSSEGEPTPHSPLEVPESVSVEAVVTELYPKMLLLAFRLLNSHFPGSPLIGQFRSTIRSHGRTSAVLGSSTGLYNELIYFYWRGCSDLPSVVSLLKEMETTGVEPDERTCGLLKAIAEQRERDLKNHRKRVRRENQDRSSPRDPWWDMAPNRTAVKELFGEDGWLPRLEKRVKEIRNLQSSTRLLADRLNL
ncbi:hypothetical protein KXV68_002876 [Aspergillus fumigatus]|nr:hypothetical protein KXX67_004110 [Aspergillus fumigatus]KAH2147089.1 hypothetical protein KXV68_002876 [Aspergillus fumigatus]KAH2359234.1 hypothetical protein KXW91_000017 [Aspergillus fumigatus]KAH2835043.1 hypothetical protein KXW76_002945 [Aspergillus fumigatus]KAH3301579.1 hypothetical protein KXW74_003319 [Aspergillus fumigatus]